MKIVSFLKMALKSTIFFSVAIILFLSLITYNCLDTSFFYKTSLPANYNNILGAFGAYTASLILHFFGFSAVFFIPFFIFYGLSSAKVFELENLDIKTFGFSVFLTSFSCLMALNNLEFFFKVAPGGMVGIYLFDFLNFFVKKSMIFGLLVFFLTISFCMMFGLKTIDFFINFLKKIFI